MKDESKLCVLDSATHVVLSDVVVTLNLHAYLLPRPTSIIPSYQYVISVTEKFDDGFSSVPNEKTATA